MTALRIALVIDYSLDYLGGAQSAFLDEARVLRERGHEVVIIAPDTHAGSPRQWVREWRAQGGTLVPVRAPVTLAGVDLPVIQNTAGLRSRLDAELRARRVQVVHVHSEFGLAAAAVSVARRRGLPTVQTVHTFFWQAPAGPVAGVLAATAVRVFARWLRGFPSSWQRLAEAPLDSALRGITLGLARRVDTVVSPSAHQAERLREAGLRRVVVVPNALASAETAGEALTEVAGPLRLVWVGRLVPEKRILEWIDAVAQAAARLPAGALEVEVVGEGPLREEAERAASGAPVRFLGRLSRARVRERMRAAHLVVLTSHGFDNQPVTIVEALSVRRGVLYVDPALREGVDEAGILADGPEPERIAATLVRLVGDPAAVVAVSERAERGAREFDPEVHAERLREIYPEPVDSRLRGDRPAS